MRRLPAGLAALTICAFVSWSGLGFAAAQESDIGVPDLTGHWRKLTRTTGTSECIGDPRSPICTVETFIACYARNDARLCRIASGPKRRPPPSGTFTPNSTLYRLLEVKRLERADFPPAWNDDGKGARPGDVKIAAWTRECWNECDRAGVRENYWVRQDGDRWWIVWYGEPDWRYTAIPPVHVRAEHRP